MTRESWFHQPAPIPGPSELAAYLLEEGWAFRTADPDWAAYAKIVSGEEVVLEVPQHAEAPDYGRAVSMLIADVARLERRSQLTVVRDVRAASVDIVRIGVEGTSTRDGRIPVEAGRRMYGAARDLLLSAACSVIEPRQAFPKRKPEEAMSLLSRARFGQTEVGSFVLTIECAVAPRFQQTLVDDGDPDAPFERKASVRLARAVQATQAAVRESTAAGRIEPFRERANDGVSANLCEAIAEMLDATFAENVWLGFSFASRRPVAAGVPRRVAFPADTSAILHEAAARLRDEASYPSTEVLGTVVKLDSTDSSAGGDAVLRIDLDGRIRHVRIRLHTEDYQRAIQAHAERAVVRCLGDLAREGRSFVLRNARDFAILSAADDE